MTDHVIPIKKTEEDQRLVFAEVYAPMRLDSDHEYMDAETIRKMAYGFMANMRLDQVDSYHNNELVPGAVVIESFIARKGDPDFIEGAWVVGVYVPDDDMWAKIKNNEINGFSVEAMVMKEPVEVQMVIPPVVDGMTMEEGGHSHKFYVSYSEDGTFLGGKTDVVDGHVHIIKRGTLTEEAEGHAHRFSYLNDVFLKE